jgi:hypothetical protein
MTDIQLRYYASELTSECPMDSHQQYGEYLKKAMAICQLSHLPVSEHFKPVCRERNRTVIKDWKLSELACSIILINEFKY